MKHAWKHILRASLLAALIAAGWQSYGQDARTLARSFFHARQVQHPSLSPDGKKIAYVLRSRKQDWLWIHDIATSASRAYEQKNDQRIQHLDWIDGTTLAFDIWTHSTSYQGYYLLNSRRQSIRKIEDEGGVLSIEHPLPFKENEALVSLDGTGDLHKLDANSGALKIAYRREGNITGFLTDSYGIARIATSTDTASPYLVSKFDKWEPLPGLKGKTIHAIADAGSTLISSQTDEEKAKVILLNFPTLKAREHVYSNSTYDVTPDAYIRNNQTYAIAGFRYQAEKPSYVWIDPDYARWHEVMSAYMPGSHIQILGSDTEKKRIVAFADADNQPGHLFVLDTENENIQSIRYSGPLLDEEELPRTMPFYFDNRHNDRIHGYITLPQTPYKKPFPLIVFARDEPTGRNAWGYDTQSLFLAKQGFAVIKVDYRGSAGYGAEHRSFTLDQILETSVEDCADAARWAVQHGFADLGKIGIYGEHFGGHIALASLAKEPKLYQTAVGFSGIYDWSNFLPQAPPSYDALFEQSPETSKLYSNLSSISLVESIEGTALLLHSQSGSPVNQDQSRAMHQTLRKVGKRSTLSLTNWQSPGKLSPDSHYALYLRLISHFENELK